MEKYNPQFLIKKSFGRVEHRLSDEQFLSDVEFVLLYVWLKQRRGVVFGELSYFRIWMYSVMTKLTNF